MIGVIRWVLHWWSSATAAPRVCYTSVVGVITDTETSAVITE